MIQTPEYFKQIREWNQQSRVSLQKEELGRVSELMLLVRGLSLMSGCYQIAHIAELGEDIAFVAQQPKNSSNKRKCVGCVWDVVTTLDFLIAQGVETTNEEQNILIHRLKATLTSQENLRQKLSQSEIDVLLRAKVMERDEARNQV